MFSSAFFSLLFRFGEFYSSVLKFTDFIICYSHPIFEPFQWDFYFCYLATFICNNMSSQKTNKINNIFKLWGFTYSFLIITLPIYFCLLIVLARTIIKMLNSRSYTIFNLLKALLKILWKFYQKYHLFHVFFFLELPLVKLRKFSLYFARHFYNDGALNFIKSFFLSVRC